MNIILKRRSISVHAQEFHRQTDWAPGFQTRSRGDGSV